MKRRFISVVINYFDAKSCVFCSSQDNDSKKCVMCYYFLRALKFDGASFDYGLIISYYLC